MAFKDCNVGNCSFPVTTDPLVVSALATFATFIAFATITAITVTTAAFAWLALLFAALVCAWPGTLRLGLLSGWIQVLRRLVHRCVVAAAFGAVITTLATAAIAVTTTVIALATLTLWSV